jgi:hypothetical protein
MGLMNKWTDGGLVTSCMEEQTKSNVCLIKVEAKIKIIYDKKLFYRRSDLRIQ